MAASFKNNIWWYPGHGRMIPLPPWKYEMPNFGWIDSKAYARCKTSYQTEIPQTPKKYSPIPAKNIPEKEIQQTSTSQTKLF